MKSRIFMYLFVFVLLLFIFQFMNSKNILANYEVQINNSATKAQRYKDSIVVLEHTIARMKRDSIASELELPISSK